MWERGELVGKCEGDRSLVRPWHRWEERVRWISRNRMGAWAGLTWLKTGTSGRLL